VYFTTIKNKVNSEITVDSILAWREHRVLAYSSFMLDMEKNKSNNKNKREGKKEKKLL
jgi:hypothetical protein